MFKKFIYMVLLLFIGSKAGAQQDPLYTHYVYNENLFNPAYAGSREMFSINSLFRAQWVSFEGAPTTVTLGASAPLKKDKIALGGAFFYDQIGATNRIGLNMQYAYRLNIAEKSKISLGIQAGFIAQKIKRSELDAYNEGDPTYTGLDASQIMPNFGAGVYVYSDRYAVGLSVPHILNNEMLNKKIVNVNNHYFLTASTIFDAGSAMKIKPSMIVKLVKGSPIQGELTANFIIKDAFWLGMGYRTDNAGTFTAMYNLVKNKEEKLTNVRIGYGYDLEWKQLRQNSKGSHEIFLSYEFKKRSFGEIYLSPRYF